MYQHTPVLRTEVLELLDPKPGDRVIDATLGGGGYTFALATRVGKKGKVLALDLDELALNHAKLKITNEKINNVILAHANFKDLASLARQTFGQPPDVTHVVFDLGLSSAQLEDRRRGFSFQADVPLNMAFGSLISKNTTEKIVNESSEIELVRIIGRYGEERFARPIARAIVSARRAKPIQTTGTLVQAIQQGIPIRFQKTSRIHFATKTFQAFRIATNDELTNLETALKSLQGIMKPGGRIAVVSFHSLEDRVVKNFFKQESRDCLCPPEFPVCRCGHKAWLSVITKKIIMASVEEIASNPRARSAKLRVAEVKN